CPSAVYPSRPPIGPTAYADRTGFSMTPMRRANGRRAIIPVAGPRKPRTSPNHGRTGPALGPVPRGSTPAVLPAQSQPGRGDGTGVGAASLGRGHERG